MSAQNKYHGISITNPNNLTEDNRQNSSVNMFTDKEPGIGDYSDMNNRDYELGKINSTTGFANNSGPRSKQNSNKTTSKGTKYNNENVKKMN